MPEKFSKSCFVLQCLLTIVVEQHILCLMSYTWNSAVAFIFKQNQLSDSINICKVKGRLCAVKSVGDNHAVRILLMFTKVIQKNLEGILAWQRWRVNFSQSSSNRDIVTDNTLVGVQLHISLGNDLLDYVYRNYR